MARSFTISMTIINTKECISLRYSGLLAWIGMVDTRGEIKGLLCTSDMLSFTHQRRDDSPSISSLDKCLLSVL